MTFKKTSFKSCCKSFLVHFILFIIVFGYAIGGAYLFIYIEQDAEKDEITAKKTAADNLKASRDYIVSSSWYMIDKPIDRDEFIFKVYKNLNLYRIYIVVSAEDHNYDGKRDEWNYDWTFPKSFLFTITTMGAIGFGHIVPKTYTGKFVCIYYGMIGIPLLLLFLANIGEFLAKSFKYIYSRLCCRWCRIRRVVSELSGTEKLKPRILWKEEVGAESYMSTEQVAVPIMINLCVIFIYLMLGAMLFRWWENWETHEGIYFSFITLSTIGFGDYVPGNSFATEDDDDDAAFISSMKMIATIGYCVFGMALLSMAIKLMQQQIVTKTKWLGKQIGISGEPEDDSWKYKNMRKHEPGTVFETPPNRDGNQPVMIKEKPKDMKRQNLIQTA